MSNSPDVEIISRKMIKPSVPTPDHLKKFKLSLFDQVNPRIYTGSLYHYSSGSGHRNAATSDHLERAFSAALDHAYPFAGRYVENELYIDCSDQGAEFREARVSSKLSSFLERRSDQIELLAKIFLPWGTVPSGYSPQTPLLAVQITTLDDGGTVVGIWNSHILGDGATTGLFMKSWAEACRSASGTAVNPYDREFVADVFPAITSGDHIPHPPPPSVVDINNPIVTNRYSISWSNVLQLVANGPENRKQPSKVVTTMALLWKALLMASASKNGSMLSVVMNLRGKVPLIGNKAFGNFITSANVKYFPAAGDQSPELHDLASLIRTSISATRAKFAGASKDEVMKMNMRSWEKRRVYRFDRFVCSSLVGAMPVYEMDFGWGKPYWASICTSAVPGIWLLDGSDEDGIEIWVNLKREQMHAFHGVFTAFLASISA